jgi:hypothetical protein
MPWWSHGGWCSQADAAGPHGPRPIEFSAAPTHVCFSFYGRHPALPQPPLTIPTNTLKTGPSPRPTAQHGHRPRVRRYTPLRPRLRRALARHPRPVVAGDAVSHGRAAQRDGDVGADPRRRAPGRGVRGAQRLQVPPRVQAAVHRADALGVRDGVAARRPVAAASVAVPHHLVGRP